MRLLPPPVGATSSSRRFSSRVSDGLALAGAEACVAQLRETGVEVEPGSEVDGNHAAS